MLVRRASRYTFKDIHDVLFPVNRSRARSDFDEGIREMRRKHARTSCSA